MPPWVKEWVTRLQLKYPELSIGCAYNSYFGGYLIELKYSKRSRPPWWYGAFLIVSREDIGSYKETWENTIEMQLKIVEAQLEIAKEDEVEPQYDKLPQIWEESFALDTSTGKLSFVPELFVAKAKQIGIQLADRPTEATQRSSPWNTSNSDTV